MELGMGMRDSASDKRSTLSVYVTPGMANIPKWLCHGVAHRRQFPGTSL